QALEPGLPRDGFELVGRLLKAGRRVRLVHRNVDGDRPRTVHPSEGDQPATLVDNHRRDREVDALCFGVRSLNELHRPFYVDSHDRQPTVLLFRRTLSRDVLAAGAEGLGTVNAAQLLGGSVAMRLTARRLAMRRARREPNLPLPQPGYRRERLTTSRSRSSS